MPHLSKVGFFLGLFGFSYIHRNADLTSQELSWLLILLEIFYIQLHYLNQALEVFLNKKKNTF